MPVQESACTQWIGTLNNPTEEEVDHILALEAKELVVDQEEGEQNGTPHLHIFLHLTKRARLSTLRKIVPRAHWEVAPNREAALNYCSKGKVLTRRLSERGKISDLEASIAVLQQNGLAAVQDAYPKMFVLHHRGLQALSCARLDRVEKQPPQVEWYWGPTGTGKSRMAIGSEVTQDNIYIQRGPFNKNSPMWWDGYNGQQTVVFDDYRPWWCPFSYLLGLLDRYPIKVQTKGGWINFVPAKIIITTPLDIESTFANFRTEEDIKQVKRRVHRVVHFCSL